MDYALQLLISILLGFYVGQWLDRKTGHEPWFTLAGIICGIILGMGLLYKRALLNQKRWEEEHKKNRKESERKDSGKKWKNEKEDEEEDKDW